MTIAEKRANEYYPELNEQDDVAAWHGFIAGYEQARKDMMKDAVVGIAQPDDCEIWVNLVGYGYKFNEGDKVRIVVLKDEEK